MQLNCKPLRHPTERCVAKEECQLGTKSQLIDFIVEKFVDSEGNVVSKSKLDSYRKADLEDLIVSRGLESQFEKWIH